MYIRTRLALWFTLIVAVVLIAFSFGLYQLTHDSLLAEVARDVQSRGVALAAAVAPGPDGRLRVPDLSAFAAPDTSAQVLDPAGRTLASAGFVGDPPLPLQRAVLAAGVVRELRVQGTPLFISVRPIVAGGTLRGYVQVTRAPGTIYTAVGRLRDLLYPGAAITLLLAGLLSWLLVRRAMRPLEELAATAAAIAAARDHTRRLALTGPPDEIRRLATTINSMLDALDAAYRQVQEVNDLQRRFVADVSHELRTPLTIMLSSLDLLHTLGADDPAFAAQTLADMRVEVERMARMVTDLLLLARTDSAASAAGAPILLEDVVADACRQSRPAGADVAFDAAGVGDLAGVLVWGNADLLKQLFLILLDNAFKYTPPGGRVAVTAHAGSDSVAVTVADSGIGIAPADLPRIFDRFYRADNARAAGGTGLGLSIAHRVAEQHGGTLVAESAPGAGSRFRVTFPLLDEARFHAQQAAAGGAASAIRDARPAVGGQPLGKLA